ncbi:electron transfer flavoprotein subunit beta/FixA family protein [Corynebacterium gottingense]|uniref:Electron transfer flavoprotein subunit beta n=1 Tax=Corynebacterium gottingense TaxID=2041036 RepID=A0ABX9UMV8_9CORY|nr:electron transfer flavoprotein subunit beta/FixA family protein [Corynebacterium gottingense]RMD20115.1 electron transfer flavoprotein subunit beta/FixA family protein [Corynebacterium gottingense]WJZ13759.1 Electron transfer flavoprotein subunit beta [Corynebacterium gottingense]WJZ16074.1 Electron transfer flavoprotein subunit beta [Corynebacterium gottingense]
MRIAVLLKEVPDTYSDRDMNLETGLTDRSGDVAADEVGERAVEAALRIAEKLGKDDVHVEVLSVGPAQAAESLRRGIAMGANDATMVTDERLVGADTTMTATVLAKLIERGDYDLVVAGTMSSDGGSGVIAPMLGELLNWPALTNLTSLDVDGDTVTATQTGDHATSTLRAQLPAVVAVSDEFADARFPNFKGLMAAKKKELTTLTLDDLGVDAEDYTPARAIMVSIDRRPPREQGEIIDASSSSAAKLVDFLESQNLI